MKCWLFCATLLVLAACGTNSNSDAPQRNPPTLEASGWREAVEPITADNANRVALLGRLDQPETSSTLFDHALSPDSTRLAALGNEEIFAWDLLTGELAFRTARNTATRLLYSSDKTELYALDPNALVHILDAERGGTANTLIGHTAYAGVFAFDSFNDRIAFGGQDGTVKVWEMFERQSVITLEAHTTPITALAFSSDGAQLASAGSDGIVRVWDWQTGTQASELPTVGSVPQRLIFSPDDAQVAIGTDRGIVWWLLTEPQQSRLLPLENGGATEILAYSPDGRFLLGGTRSGGLSVWNVITSLPVGALPDVAGSQVSTDFSPEGTVLLTSALGGSVSLWTLAQTDEQALSRAQLPTGEGQIYAADWTDDGRLLLLFDATGPVYAWGIAASAAEG